MNGISNPIYSYILIGLLVWLAAGCQSTGTFSPQVSLQPTTSTPTALPFIATPTTTWKLVSSLPASTPDAPENSQPTPANAYEAGLVAEAKADLAKRLGMEEEAIDFASFEMRIWPDGSLGCPQPGMAYTQVQQEGYRIQLRVADVLYAYHGGEKRRLFLCQP